MARPRQDGEEMRTRQTRNNHVQSVMQSTREGTERETVPDCNLCFFVVFADRILFVAQEPTLNQNSLKSHLHSNQ